MGKEAALVEEASRLYIQEGLTLAEIARRLPVAQRTLERWSTHYEWPRRRRQYMASEQTLSEMVDRLKKRLALMALDENADPQKIYALCRVVAVLKPPAQAELKKIEEEEGQKQSPEELQALVAQVLETEYGIKR